MGETIFGGNRGDIRGYFVQVTPRRLLSFPHGDDSLVELRLDHRCRGVRSDTEVCWFSLKWRW